MRNLLRFTVMMQCWAIILLIIATSCNAKNVDGGRRKTTQTLQQNKTTIELPKIELVKLMHVVNDLSLKVLKLETSQKSDETKLTIISNRLSKLEYSKSQHSLKDFNNHVKRYNSGASGIEPLKAISLKINRRKDPFRKHSSIAHLKLSSNSGSSGNSPISHLVDRYKSRLSKRGELASSKDIDLNMIESVSSKETDEIEPPGVTEDDEVASELEKENEIQESRITTFLNRIALIFQNFLSGVAQFSF